MTNKETTQFRTVNIETQIQDLLNTPIAQQDANLQVFPFLYYDLGRSTRQQLPPDFLLEYGFDTSHWLLGDMNVLPAISFGTKPIPWAESASPSECAHQTIAVLPSSNPHDISPLAISISGLYPSHKDGNKRFFGAKYNAKTGALFQVAVSASSAEFPDPHPGHREFALPGYDQAVDVQAYENLTNELTFAAEHPIECAGILTNAMRQALPEEHTRLLQVFSPQRFMNPQGIFTLHQNAYTQSHGVFVTHNVQSGQIFLGQDNDASWQISLPDRLIAI